MGFPRSVEALVRELEKLPGIGRRSAERLALHILKLPHPEAVALARAIRDARVETRRCVDCKNVTDAERCEICADPERASSTLLVVEDPRDVEAFERAGVHRGRYHVLMGALNPSDGVEPRHLGIEELVARVRAGGIEELVLALDPDFEGDGTALVLAEALRPTGIKITRLARGIPAGSSIEHLNRAVLQDALEGRRPLL
ncbi:MAG: recombination protein RecR [Planctomycetes bacterium]|nr:recombination protein RecR [Planctomycetota bacterium]